MPVTPQPSAPVSSPPSISVLCAADGYPRLLPELVESFLRQDYAGLHELVILNDTPGQRLICNAQNVVVINAEAKFPTAGDKRNELLSLAQYDIVCFWESTDIYLPQHLTVLASRLQKPWRMSTTGCALKGEEGRPPSRVFRGNMLGNVIVEKAAIADAGGFPLTDAAPDTLLLTRLLTSRCLKGTPPDKDGTPTHIHRLVTPPVDPAATGTIVITPVWPTDYAVSPGG